MKFCTIFLLTFILCGCASARQQAASDVTVTPYDAYCLRNMWLAKDFISQGRFELAREHYLLALAASKDAETKNAIARELAGVDMMIKTAR